MGYSEEEKLDMIEIFYLHGKNASIARNEYHRRFPDRPIPTRRTILNIVKQLNERKTLKRKVRTVERNAEEDLIILLYFEENPERSIPDAATFFNKSWHKIHSVLKYYKYKPYKFLPTQELTDQNKIDRLHFCQEIERRVMMNQLNLSNIIFTDEATFTTGGMFNRKNKHFWSKENPRALQAVKIQGRRSLHVWCGLLNNHVIGPIFLNGNLTGQRYQELLENEIEGHLEQLPINSYLNLVWQQDGAPPHNVQPVTNFLNDRYPFWIGRHGPLRWPANSPDLSPLDIFLWGYLKNKIYYNRPRTIQALEQKIVQAIDDLNTQSPHFIYASIHRKFRRNIQKCIINQGGYIENQN